MTKTEHKHEGCKIIIHKDRSNSYTAYIFKPNSLRTEESFKSDRKWHVLNMAKIIIDGWIADGYYTNC